MEDKEELFTAESAKNANYQMIQDTQERMARLQQGAMNKGVPKPVGLGGLRNEQPDPRAMDKQVMYDQRMFEGLQDQTVTPEQFMADPAISNRAKTEVSKQFIN